MYKKNKLGIKVYDENTSTINGITYIVNSISINKNFAYKLYNRFINLKNYGFRLKKYK